MPDLFAVKIGQYTAQGFAVPQRLNFGGAQRLGVHQMPAGARVIDSMGPDEDDISWDGMFVTGQGVSDAVQAAQQIDLYRIKGQPLTLSWDIFQYTVVVEHFTADEEFITRVPFKISCKVVQNLTSPAMSGASDGAVVGQAAPTGGGDVDSLVNSDMNNTLDSGEAAGMNVPSGTPSPVSTNPGAAEASATEITWDAQFQTNPDLPIDVQQTDAINSALANPGTPFPYTGSDGQLHEVMYGM